MTFKYLYKSKILPNFVRTSKSTETATLFTMHVCLSSLQTDVLTENKASERAIYGPSKSNPVSSFTGYRLLWDYLLNRIFF